MCDSPSPPARQASAPEVEITPEMIEAGVIVLLGFDSAEIFDSAGVVVSEIYAAMRSIEPLARGVVGAESLQRN